MGAYRLVTDPLIRKAVWDKVKHATVRGLAVAGVYFCLSYRIQRWFVAKFLMGSQNWFAKKFGPDTSRVGSGLGWIKQENMLNCECYAFFVTYKVLTCRYSIYCFGLSLSYCASFHPPSINLYHAILSETQHSNCSF